MTRGEAKEETKRWEDKGERRRERESSSDFKKSVDRFADFGRIKEYIMQKSASLSVEK